MLACCNRIGGIVGIVGNVSVSECECELLQYNRLPVLWYCCVSVSECE